MTGARPACDQGGPHPGEPGAQRAPRLLILEDDPYDAELELRELTRYGVTFSEVRVVDNEPDFLAGLRDFAPEVILADYRLPGMTGEQALEHALARCPQVPFVFVSGTLGEDHAIELVKRGAWDYVLKDRPSRLGPAVSRSLREAGERRRLEAERALALQQLREQSRQLRAIVDTVQDGLSVFEAVRDPAGRIVDFAWVYANPVAAQIMHRSPGQVVGQNLLDLLPSLGRMLFDQFVDIVRTGRPLGYLLADVDDAPVRGTFEGRAARLGDGFVVVYRDVTDRLAAERALRRSEARYRGLVVALGEGILVQDGDGVVVECNQAAERILGLSRTALIGRPYPGADQRVLAEDGTALAVTAHPTVRALSTGRPGGGRVIGLPDSAGLVRWVLANAEPLGPGETGELEGVVTSYTDLTELRRAQQELQASEERFRLAFEEALTGMALIDVAERPGRFLRVNRALTEFLGLPVPELLRSDLSRVCAEENRATLRRALGEVIAGGVCRYRAEHRFVHADGRPRWAVLSVSMVRDRGGGPLYALAAVEDITARKDAERELAYKALHDELTGLPNRALLLERLRSALARARRNGTRVGLLFIDLDDFKSVNDSFGHEGGDQFLIEVADRIRSSRREADTAVRIGGDEFVVVCEDLTDPTDATTVAQRIQAALSSGITIAGQTVSAPASIGISISDEHATPETVLRDADQAMYTAKRRGGRRWHPADALANTSAYDMLSLEADLRAAIDKEQLRLYYQPTFRMSDGKLVGVEALLRWQHPTRGLLLPQPVIDVAERRNLIGLVGSWVLTTACAQAAAWQRQFGSLAPVVAVNISARELGDHLCRRVQEEMGQHGLPADGLCLEVTESQFITVGSSGIAELQALAEAGITIAVDDFGTGFSGFDYLRKLPVHTLKIDKSYVDGIGRDPTDTAIVASVITLARQLGLTTVAEGIESAEQRDSLRELGCAVGQGWLWHPALPPDEITGLLRSAAPGVPARGTPAPAVDGRES
ncbi:MAG TPA: EAL domain-containing protein [Kineosporiaceae bacterium]|nr:EAL domain-containing protein [Kineosporiaceae bacterium]